NLNLTDASALVLHGSATDVFIFNIYGSASFEGLSSVALTGGIVPEHVLFNIIGSGPSRFEEYNRVSFSGLSDVQGTIMAIQRAIKFSGKGRLHGAVVAKGHLKLSGKTSAWSFDAAPFCKSAN